MEVIIHACYLQMELGPGALDVCHGSGFRRNIAEMPFDVPKAQAIGMVGASCMQKGIAEM